MHEKEVSIGDGRTAPVPLVTEATDYVIKNKAEIGFFIEAIGQTFEELDDEALRLINEDPLLPQVLKKMSKGKSASSKSDKPKTVQKK